MTQILRLMNLLQNSWLSNIKVAKRNPANEKNYMANWYYLAQLVGIGGICLVVGKKWENNAAHFYMAHVSEHMLIQSCSLSLSTLPLSQENLISQEEVADSWKKVSCSIINLFYVRTPIY